MVLSGQRLAKKRTAGSDGEILSPPKRPPTSMRFGRGQGDQCEGGDRLMLPLRLLIDVKGFSVDAWLRQAWLNSPR